jgi:hypothetical protein
MNWAREAEGRAALQTGQMEWYTPSKYIELARTVYNAELRSTLSAEKAEEETKISQQQVSRWRKELARPEYAKRCSRAQEEGTTSSIRLRVNS